MSSRSSTVFFFFSFLAEVLLATSAGASESGADLRADYDRLLQGRYEVEARTVPPEGLRWSLEGALWTLESGRLRLAEPTASGAVTGLVFEGKGRFRLDVPDSTELAQLRRFSRRPELTALDTEFSSFVLRFAGPPPFGLAPKRDESFAPSPLALERHQRWRLDRWFDADARIVAALATPGDGYYRMEMTTRDFEGLTFELDGRRREEVRVTSYNASYSWEEAWLSLDRAAERDARGRPSGTPPQAVDLLHVDLAVDLTKAGRDKGWMAGRFASKLRFRVAAGTPSGARALQLRLHPLAKVSAVREGGSEVLYLRDAFGKRERTLDNRLFDESLLLLLARPLVPGEERTIDVDYELEMRNFAAGRLWYPSAEGEESILADPHTAHLELTVRPRHEARAMGRRSETEGGGGAGRETTVWRVDEPTKMLSFVYAAEKFHETRLPPGEEGNEGPEVVCFGERVGLSTDGKFFNVCADVSNSIRYFERLFAQPLARRPFYVTSIDGSHGQSFESFLELSQGSFWAESPGAAELFRAHEVAHQWWGHLVGAASYRDVWLGEAFAEYSAMMYVEAAVKDGTRIFHEILRAHGDEVTGSLKSGFSKFARPGVSLVNRAYGDRIGPIGFGWRANTGEVRTAYSSQVYNKGSLVLHMLRHLVGDMTKSDAAFGDILRDFLARHRGGLASTADFEAAVTRRVPADWAWFFDQWVRGTEIPTYRWTYKLIPGVNDRGLHLAQLQVTQRDVSPAFKMLVPVEAELADGSKARTRVLVDKADQVFNLTFPQRPKSIVFNPEGEILSRTKRE